MSLMILFTDLILSHLYVCVYYCKTYYKAVCGGEGQCRIIRRLIYACREIRFERASEPCFGFYLHVYSALACPARERERERERALLEMFHEWGSRASARARTPHDHTYGMEEAN